MQLAAQLRKQIESGQIRYRLPSLLELADETGLAIGTIRRAVKVLAGDRLVRTVPGRGTFVRRGSG